MTCPKVPSRSRRQNNLKGLLRIMRSGPPRVAGRVNQLPVVDVSQTGRADVRHFRVQRPLKASTLRRPRVEHELQSRGKGDRDCEYEAAPPSASTCQEMCDQPIHDRDEQKRMPRLRHVNQDEKCRERQHPYKEEHIQTSECPNRCWTLLFLPQQAAARADNQRQPHLPGSNRNELCCVPE